MSTLKSWNELTVGDRFLPCGDGYVMTVLRPVSETPQTRTLLVGSAFSSLEEMRVGIEREDWKRSLYQVV